MAKYDLLAAMPPWQGGGEMIDRVSFEGTTFQAPPFRFEAGTPHIAGAVGLGAAIEWFTGLDQGTLRRHENAVFAELDALLRAFPGVAVIGSAPDAAAAQSPSSLVVLTQAMSVPSWIKPGWRSARAITAASH